MNFRLATNNDIPAISELKYKMFKEVDMANLLSDNFNGKVIETYIKLYSEGKAQHYIMEDNQVIVACAGAFIKEDIPYCFFKDQVYGFIGDVYVESLYRQRGYARILTNAVLECFISKEIKTVRLLASHHALHLYESLGFEGTAEMVLNI
jgi:ribosomal protein S18 acetylase RimI-like enzyme